MRKSERLRPYFPQIIDADTAAYMLCLSRSAFDDYVSKGILPRADASFGNVKRWRWSTLDSRISELNQDFFTEPETGYSTGNEPDPYIEGLKNG